MRRPRFYRYEEPVTSIPSEICALESKREFRRSAIFPGSTLSASIDRS